MLILFLFYNFSFNCFFYILHLNYVKEYTIDLYTYYKRKSQQKSEYVENIESVSIHILKKSVITDTPQEDLLLLT